MIDTVEAIEAESDGKRHICKRGARCVRKDKETRGRMSVWWQVTKRMHKGALILNEGMARNVSAIKIMSAKTHFLTCLGRVEFPSVAEQVNLRLLCGSVAQRGQNTDKH